MTVSGQPRILTARITHLEMTQKPSRRVPAPIGHLLAVMRSVEMPLHFYRYLYEQVGRPHHWQMRRTVSALLQPYVLCALEPHTKYEAHQFARAQRARRLGAPQPLHNIRAVNHGLGRHLYSKARFGKVSAQ